MSTRLRVYGVAALLAAAAAWLAAAGGARAQTLTLGESALSPHGGTPTLVGQNIPVFQGASSGGYTLSAPAGGTITSWSFLSGGVSQGRHFVLRVLSPVAGAPGSWRAVGTSAAAAVSSSSGEDALNGPFATHLAIAAGDVIALQPTDDVYAPIEEGLLGADGFRFFLKPLAEGASAELAPGSESNNGQVVPVRATLETEGTGTPPPTGGGPGSVAALGLSVPRAAAPAGSPVLISPSAPAGVSRYAYSFGAAGSARCDAAHPLLAARFSAPASIGATVTALAGSVPLASGSTALTVTRAVGAGSAPAGRSVLSSYTCAAGAAATQGAQHCASAEEKTETTAGLAELQGCFTETTDINQVPAGERLTIEETLAIEELILLHARLCETNPRFCRGRAAAKKKHAPPLRPVTDTFLIFHGDVRMDGITLHPGAGASVVMAVGGTTTSFASQHVDLLASSNVSASLRGDSSISLPLSLPSEKPSLTGSLRSILKGGAAPTPLSLELSDLNPEGRVRASKSVPGSTVPGVLVGRFSLANYLPLPLRSLSALKAVGSVPVYVYNDEADGEYASEMAFNVAIPGLELTESNQDDGTADTSQNGVTASWTLDADNERGLHVREGDLVVIPKAFFGPLPFDDLHFHYDGARDTLHASALAHLFGGRVSADVDVSDLGGRGSLDSIVLQYTAGVGEGITIVPDQVSLTHAQLAMNFHPLKLEGNVTLSFLQSISNNGCGIAGWHGSGSIAFEPLSVSGAGNQEFACANIGEGNYVYADVNGNVALGRTISFVLPDPGGGPPLFAVRGSIGGRIDFPHIQFDGGQNVEANAFGIGGKLGGYATLSDQGLGFCAEVTSEFLGQQFHWHPGFGVRYGAAEFLGAIGGAVFVNGALPEIAIAGYLLSHVDVQKDSCDITRYQSIRGSASARKAGAALSFGVPAGEHVAVLDLRGSGGAPAVILHGPAGRLIDATGSAPVLGPDHFVVRAPVLSTTEIEVADPAAGTWTIEPAPGSPPITLAQAAAQLPPLHVRGSVRTHGRTALLRYVISAPSGATVTLFDQGVNGAGRRIGVARGSRGSLRFTPSPARPEDRAVYALITAGPGSGQPALKVAAYHVRPLPLGRATHIAARVRAHRLLISFRPGAGATGSGIGVRLSDGSTVSLTLHGSRGRVTLPGRLPAGVRARRILIRTLGAAGLGPLATRQLR